MNKQKIFVAGAWPYVNGDIHIGHLAGYFLPLDIFSRFSRLDGKDVLAVSGSDCHGTPITVEADKRGIPARELVEQYIPKVHELIDIYNISYDLFTSTITENHKKVTQEVFLRLLENGYILKQKSLQYFSSVDNRFLPDRYVEGECPYCHAKDQRADQCENCGRSLGLGELINPKSKLSKSDVELKETEHYFIDFPKLQDQIKSYAEQTGSNWKDWVYKETMGFLNEGLQPRAITRDLDWGVEIPKNNIPQELQIENIESKRFYVWFDAVIGYLSASIEWAEKNNRDYKEFWHNPNAKHYYFLGQDNLTFHTIFWPAQLIGQNLGYNLPDFPSVVKFLNANGQKLSKSRGNIIDAKEIAQKFSADSVRFYITSILPENKEANWDWNDFKNTVNSNLVGNAGNFIHRTLTFYKNKLNAEVFSFELDQKIKEESEKVFAEVKNDLENCKFTSALDKILKYSSLGNQYFDHNKSWEVLKTNPIEAQRIIFNCLQIVKNLGVLLKPFIPNSIEKLEQLGFLVQNFDFELIDLSKLDLSSDLKPLFAKIEEE